MTEQNPMTERILYDFTIYRVVTRPPASEYGDTVFVQKRGDDGGWSDVRSYNTLSNDWAYTNARDDADQSARHDLLEKFGADASSTNKGTEP